MKFDIHLNVGTIYKTNSSRSKELFYTGKEIADYCNFYKITHCVCIYSHYQYIEELQQHAPNTKVYGVQWITDFANDKMDIGKPLFQGIKLHSNRGYRMVNGELTYGLDYGDFNLVESVLNKLPDNHLVYMHTGCNILGNKTSLRCSPDHVFTLATKYNNLKFIMGHAGVYGGMFTSEPSIREVPTTITNNSHVYTAGVRNHVNSMASTKKAVMYANYTHNIFLDGSIHTRDKARELKNTPKWAVGSDYPYGYNREDNFTEIDFKDNYTWDYNFQCRQYEKRIGNIDHTHKNAIKFIETNVIDLAKEHGEFYTRVKGSKSFCHNYYSLENEYFSE